MEQQQQQQHHHLHHEATPLLPLTTTSSEDMNGRIRVSEEDSLSADSSKIHNNNSDNNNDDEHANASVFQTVLNLMKTCMGSGCLGLPYACQQGGIAVFAVGLLLIAMWNVYSIQRLILCLEYIPRTLTATKRQQLVDRNETDFNNSEASSEYLSCYDEQQGDASDLDDKDSNMMDHPQAFMISSPTTTSKNKLSPSYPTPEIHHDHPHHRHHESYSYPSQMPPPPPGISTLGRVAWYAFGRIGLEVLDVMMMCLLLGVIVAYLTACISFLTDTVYFNMGPVGNAIFCTTIMAALSLVPNLSYLSSASALGLVVLALAFAVIAGYGIVAYGKQDDASSTSTSHALNFWPALDESNSYITGLTHFFGICVFCYGVVPLSYNFQESMAEPSKMVWPATWVAHLLVFLTYVVMGIGLYACYPHLSGEVLHELPSHGWLPVVTRLAMVWVLLVTGPLLIVPTGELLEGKFPLWSGVSLDSSNSNNNARNQRLQKLMHRMSFRFGVCTFCVVVAVSLPNFVEVLSLVGCACVGVIAFIVPPILHLRLSSLHLRNLYFHPPPGGPVEAERQKQRQQTQAIVDCIMLVCGSVATVVSTLYTIKHSRMSSKNES